MTLPLALKKKIASENSRERESAVTELQNYPEPDSIKHLVRLLGDEDAHVVNLVERALVAMEGDDVIEEIINLLRSDEARIRSLATRILVKKGPEVLSPIMSLANDNDRDVRKFAVDILKQIGGPETEDTLIMALFDEDNNVAMAAAEAVGGLRFPRAVPHLIECVAKEPWLKYAALKSLGEIGGVDALNAILAIELKEESIVLFHAVTALGTIGDIRGLDFLITLLEKKDATLLPSIVQAIEKIINNSDDSTISLVKSNIPIHELISLLGHPNTDAVRSAISLLGIFREESAIEELVHLYSESNRHLFEDLEEAFLKIRSNRVELFIEIIENPMEPESVKTAAVKLLGKIDGDRTFDPLVACLAKASTGLQQEIITVLAMLKEKRAVPVLHDFLEGEQTELIQSAIEALETFREEASISHLLKLAEAPSEKIRSMASSSLRTYNLNAHKDAITSMLMAEPPELVCFGLDSIPKSMAPEFNKDIFLLGKHKSEIVRARAITRINFFPHDKAFEMITHATQDEASQVRLAAVRGLANYPDRETGTLLYKIAATDPDEWLRYETVKVIGRTSLVELLDDLTSLLETAPDIVKIGILDVLGEKGGQHHMATLRKYTKATNEQVQEAATEAMERLGTTDE